MPKLRIPPVLRPHAGNQTSVDVAGDTLGDALESLFAAHPALRERMLDDDGIRRFVNVYVDEEDVRLGEGLATPLTAGSSIIVLPAMSGGAA
jgi:molybdopterin converting factor small subunit